MDEKNNEKLDTGELVIKKGKLLSFLDNFWYHYKWHSLIALFLIFAITVCTLQMCKKESYDAQILYAGGYRISKENKDGDIAEYETVMKMLGRVAPDADGDGESRIVLRDLFILSNEEIAEIEKDEEYEVNYSAIMENGQILKDSIVYSDYYVCLLSPAVYENYKVIDDFNVFARLDMIEAEGEAVEYYDECAVKLSSLDFYSLPGIAALPEDTLVCLRELSPYSLGLNKKGATKAYNTGLEIIKEMINYSK